MNSLVFFCLFIFTLVLCSPPEASAQSHTVRFVFQNRIADVLSLVAIKKGFFAEEGLIIKPLIFSDGPSTAEALFSGSADIVTMGDAAAIIAASRNQNFRIIASHSTGEHRHRIMVRSDSPLKSFGDLSGKKVGIKKGTSTYGGFLEALQKNNLSLSSVHVLDLSPDVMTNALFAGSIDAFVASEPTPSAAEEKGARQLATLGGLENEYPILLVTKADWLQANRSEAVRFLRALKKAAHFVRENPLETAGIVSTATGMKAETAKRAMQIHQYSLRLDKPILSSLEKTATFLKDQKTIPAVPDFSVVTDPAHLAAAIKDSKP